MSQTFRLQARIAKASAPTLDVRARIIRKSVNTFTVKARILPLRSSLIIPCTYEVSVPQLLSIGATYFAYGDNYLTRTLDIGAFITPDLNLTVTCVFFVVTNTPFVGADATINTVRTLNIAARIYR